MVTNNEDCRKRYDGSFECLYDSGWNYGQVLHVARDLLHQGCVLLSHPMSGSLKPNQTPYRSLILARGSLPGVPDGYNGLLLLEQAIAIYQKFQKNRATPDWPENIRREFRLIDLSLIEQSASRCQQDYY